MSPRIKSESPPLPVPLRQALRFRARTWISLVIVVALGVGSHYLWRQMWSRVAHEPHYLLTADKVHVTSPPPWIRTDIKSQVLRESGLAGTASILDDWDLLAKRVQDAFEFHPWIASVTRITRRLPSSLEVELVYRRPIAAVESSDPSGVMFLPIDENAVRLPEADFTEAERRYLPRISGITGRPLVGDKWQDPRVIGGARLAAQLADVWQQLCLVEIVGNLQSQAREVRPIYRYDIVTAGGTRIVWGTTPGDEPITGESPFAEKRKRLLEYAAQNGKLESIDGPAVLDVRSELVVTPRTAKNQRIVPSEKAVQSK